MQVKKRIFAGAVCDQVIYEAEEGTRAISTKNPRPRFKNDEEREEHKRLISERHFILLVNANFGPSSIFSTLTFDDENECHDYNEAKILRDRYWDRLKTHFPDAKIVVVMGRGKTTDRIHLHMISDRITAEELTKYWTYGEIKRHDNLREHNRDPITKEDLGQDYTSLAKYLFKHYDKEQGKGKRYKATRNLRQPEEEEPTPCIMHYSEAKPPRPPKGYKYTGDCIVTRYGYMRFHYVKIPEKKRERKKSFNLPYIN